jgi:fatty acid-binding protein DegV
MINPDDWKMAERIAENSSTFKTPQEAIAAFENLMKQVEAEGDQDD